MASRVFLSNTGISACFRRCNMLLLVLLGTLIQSVMGQDRDKTTGEKMTIGLIAGFGFIAGVAAIAITVWCFCCGNGCRSDILKVAPMDLSDPETCSTLASSKGIEPKRTGRNEKNN